MVISKLKEMSFPSKLEFAIMYYSIIATWYKIKLTKTEIQLISFISVRGTISSPSAKEDFSKRFNCSQTSINNMVHHIKPTGVLIKRGNKIVINPQLALNFNKPLTLNLIMKHGEE